MAIAYPARKPIIQPARQHLADRFRGAELSMEHEREIEDIYDRAIARLKDCPDTDELAHIALRAIERNLNGHPADRETVAEAQQLAARFPRSAPVATARARLEATLEAARAAVAIDGKYPPANLALAVALLASGDRKGARAALGLIPDLERVDDGYATLARLDWAEGDVDGAMAAAKKQLTSQGGIEPGFNVWPGRRIAHEILALGYLKKKRTREAARHLAEADPESDPVRSLFPDATADLKKAPAKEKRKDD